MPLEMRLYAPPPTPCHLIYITPLLQLKRALNSVLIIPIRDCVTGEVQVLAIPCILNIILAVVRTVEKQ